MKHLIAIFCLTTALFAIGRPAEEGAPIPVSVSSKGDSVRVALHSIFEQAEKSYVLAPNTHFALHLSLRDVPFDEALQIICRIAKLEYEVDNGVYYLQQKQPPQKPKTPPPTKPESKPETKPESKPVTKPEAPKGKLPESVLNKRLTTRFQKKDLRELLSNISAQTGVTIEVEKSVPAYKLDAFLIETSLKYALDQITQAAKLKYRFTDRQTIEIYQEEPPKNRVTVVSE